MPRPFIRPATTIALALACVLTLNAQAPRVTFSDTRLDNGLRVIISEDHSAPVFSVAVNYNVGSRDERPGRTGFAHLFEHMMFKGSEQVGPGEHFTLIFGNGGTMNGTTNKDRTLYYETLPANQLEMVLFLEADRMWSLDVTKENLDNQRNAVQEERRLAVDNQPYGRTFEVIDDLAYDNFAYEHSVIGSMADLDAATVDDVKSFFRTYYAPNNAVLAIVGDVNTDATLALVRKYFDRIPRQPAPPEVDMSEPPQTEERRQTLEDALARLTRIDIAYKVPPSDSPDDAALTVLANVLSSGRSSRLYASIVREQQLASAMSAGKGESRGPGLFRFTGTLLPGKDLAALESAVYAEIQKVAAGPIEDWEMQKAQNGARRTFISGLGSSLTRAVLLSQYAIFYDDPGRINTQADRIAAVTAADVMRVARQYLVPEHRTVVITVPRPGGAGGGQ